MSNIRAYPEVQLGQVCDIKLGKMLQPSSRGHCDREVPYLRSGSLESLDEPDAWRMMYCSPRELELYRLQTDDLLVAEGGEIGRAEFVPGLPPNAIFQNSLHRLRLRADGDLRFVRYALESVRSSGWLDVLCNRATFGHLTLEKLCQLRIPWPSPIVQTAIADWLDSAITSIERLITARHRQVEVLEERLLNVVHTAIHRKYTHNNRISDVSPLGTVADTWRPHKIAWHKRTASGTTPKSGSSDYYGDTEGIPWVTTSELRERMIDETAQRVSDAAFRDYSVLEVFPEGTVLVAMYGATIGRVGTLGVPAATNQACCAMFGGETLDQRYLYWWLWANTNLLVSMAVGAGQPNISQEMIRSLRVPAPLVGEQQEIARQIENAASSIELVKHKAIRLMELLAERRRALITSAVAGATEVTAPNECDGPSVVRDVGQLGYAQ